MSFVGHFLARTHPSCTLLGWCTSIAILVLSVMPASERPVTGAGLALEHLAAFAISGGLFAVGRSASSSRIAVYAVVGCASVECLQTLVPTRHARFSDFIINAVASLVAIGVVTALRRLSRVRR